jgi:hypothetical protein
VTVHPALARLGTLVDAQRTRRATPKHQIEKSVITKDDKRKSKKAKGDAFRDEVWTRDKKRSRASGKPLSRSGTDPHKVGEVHHVIPRSLAPERVHDVANGLLLSRFEHALAETTCPNAPAHHYLDIVGPDDRGKRQTFIWRDKDGNEKKRKVG